MKLILILAAGWMVGGGLVAYYAGLFMAWGLRDADEEERRGGPNA